MLRDEAEFKILKECRGNRHNKVYVVEHGPSRKKMILKMIKIKNLESQMQEVLVHRSLNHNFVIRFLDSDIKDDYIRVLIEFAKFGDLFELLPRLPSLGEETVLKLYYKVLKAVDYLHSKGLAHRDIKPENILITDKMVPKLADFGTTKGFQQTRQTFCGTYEYMAPEVLNKKTQSPKVDVWSMGILLYEMTHMTTPFAKSQLSKVEGILSRGEIPFKNGLNPDIRRLVRVMLQFNPEKRPTISNIVNDVLFARFRGRESCNPVINHESPIETPPSASMKQSCSLRSLDHFEFSVGKIKNTLEHLRQMKAVCATMEALPEEPPRAPIFEQKKLFFSPKKDVKAPNEDDPNFFSADKANPSFLMPMNHFTKKSYFGDLNKDEQGSTLSQDTTPKVSDSANDLSGIRNFFTGLIIPSKKQQEKKIPSISSFFSGQSAGDERNIKPVIPPQSNTKLTSICQNSSSALKLATKPKSDCEIEASLRNMDLEKLKEMQLTIRNEIKKKEGKNIYRTDQCPPQVKDGCLLPIFKR